jgi:hypothetical protein
MSDQGPTAEELIDFQVMMTDIHGGVTFSVRDARYFMFRRDQLEKYLSDNPDLTHLSFEVADQEPAS